MIKVSFAAKRARAAPMRSPSRSAARTCCTTGSPALDEPARTLAARRPTRSASSARSARSPRPSSSEGERPRRLLLVGLGAERTPGAMPRAGRRRADRAAADLGRDPAGHRPRRPQTRRRAAAAARASARARAAGATTSTAPSSAASRSRRSTKWSIVGAGEGAEAEWAQSMRPCSTASTLTRDLVTEPRQHHLSRKLRRALPRGDGRASASSSRCSTRRRWRKLGMGALLGVAQGSVRPPRLLVDALERRQARREAGRLRRQGHHLRHRRHLDQAGRSAWKR